MVEIKPFKAIRPRKELVDKVAALPYDVMSTEEAREMVRDNPYSFLHVDKAEIDLDPAIDPYAEEVYQKARENLDRMIEQGVYNQDETDNFYIYRQVMEGRAQTGLVACTSIDDYLGNIIKKHEYTRPDKEQDRITHVDTTEANTGPIFLTYKSKDWVSGLIDYWTRNKSPLYDFNSEDGITHTCWVIDCADTVSKLVNAFAKIDYLYIADGHHRAASAVKVGQMRREHNPNYTGKEEFNFFLSVLFPHDQLKIMDYNRVVKDLNKNSEEEFINKVKGNFFIEQYQGTGQFKPEQKHDFGMFLNNIWFKLTAKPGTYDESDPVEGLDVSILQNNLLKPILGIEDPRTNKRIDFVGGIRGLAELEKRVKEDMKVAFALYPTSIEELMAIADVGEVMPPKSTWFEPKLRSGIFIHRLVEQHIYDGNNSSKVYLPESSR